MEAGSRSWILCFALDTVSFQHFLFLRLQIFRQKVIDVFFVRDLPHDHFQEYLQTFDMNPCLAWRLKHPLIPSVDCCQGDLPVGGPKLYRKALRDRLPHGCRGVLGVALIRDLWQGCQMGRNSWKMCLCFLCCGSGRAISCSFPFRCWAFDWKVPRKLLGRLWWLLVRVQQTWITWAEASMSRTPVGNREINNPFQTTQNCCKLSPH